ncbi:MAG: YcxB family protein [Collinsella sp.]|nr:YcxB family protein [Collinsella sp.]
MSKALTYRFKVDPALFRKALYFNTFAKQRFQSFLIGAMWLFGVGLAAANLLFRVQMNNVMQLCYVVLLAALPLLVFSCENSYRQYRSAPLHDKLREVSLSDDWIKLQVVGGSDSEKLEWRMIAAVYDLDDFFIIYRDLNLMVLLPKHAIPENDVSVLRVLFSKQLGRAFHRRTKG